MPANDEETPSTLERSPAKVRRTYEEALDAAHEQYEGDEARAHRVAWAAVKHIAEKKGDHWELKDEPGPSDEQAARSGRFAREGRAETHGGIDAGKSRSELYEDAKEAGIPGRSKMSKDELVAALERHSRRETARARGD
jgi:cation transport regulator ChaB